MDVSQAVAIAVASLPMLAPYAVKMAEGMVAEIGKATGQGVAKKVYELYRAIRARIHKDNDPQAEIALEKTVQGTAGGGPLEPIILQKAAADPEFSSALIELATDIRNLLLDCFKQRFTMPDVREVYTRVHIGFEDLIGPLATKSEKAQVLIEKMEMQGRTPELIAAMWKVNPDLGS